MLLQQFKRLVRKQDGLEIIESAIVGALFAVATAAFWGTLATSLDTDLDAIKAEVPPAS